MLSIQEMVNKTADQRKKVEFLLDDKAHFDINDASILREQKPAARKELMETLRRVPLREFLAKSGDTGIAGAAYLVPDKIYQVMFDSAVQADIVADISIAMVPASEIPGSTLKVDVAKDDSYAPHLYSSGGAMPDETIETVQPELDFTSAFGINFRITNDLIEDSQFDVIEMHLRNAGREMGEFASNLAVTVLITGTDGDGTLNAGWSGTADVTKWTGEAAGKYDIETAIDENVKDGFVSDTMLMSHHPMLDEVIRTLGSSSNTSEPWINNVVSAGGWPTQMFDMNIIYSEVDALTNPLDGTAYENCYTVVFDKDYALLSGRKRWLRIEKYSNPIKDLVGATVTARQDSVTVYNDSICLVKET